MFKLRTMLFSVVAAGFFVMLSSTTASAQWNMSAADRQKYTNNPCSNPFISWALWDEGAGFRTPTGGFDCNPANYGSYSTPLELVDKLRAYRDSLRRQGVSLGGLTAGSDGHTTQSVLVNGVEAFRFEYAGKLLTSDGAGVVGTGGSSAISNHGAGVVSQGGGNVVGTGGSSIISHDGGTVVSQGGGNFYGVKAAGDVVVQLPGRWVRISPAAPQSAQPARPATPGGTGQGTAGQVQTSQPAQPTRPGQRPNPSDQETAQWRQRGPCSDPWVSKAVTEFKGRVNGYQNQGDCQPGLYNGGSWSNYDALYRAVASVLGSQRSTTPTGSTTGSAPRDDGTILTCLGTTVNQIRGRDSGANRINLTVTSGTAAFLGNVLTQAYKDQLINAARNCGARAADTSRLVVTSASAPAQPSRPSGGGSSPSTDDSILTCTNRAVANARAASAANRITVTVSSGTTYFTGTVTSQAWKDSLSQSARGCGARGVNNNLTVASAQPAQPAQPSCRDGIKNGTESDVDCGGSCAKCSNGRTCRSNSDCASNNCNPSTHTCR